MHVSVPKLCSKFTQHRGPFESLLPRGRGIGKRATSSGMGVARRGSPPSTILELWTPTRNQYGRRLRCLLTYSRFILPTVLLCLIVIYPDTADFLHCYTGLDAKCKSTSFNLAAVKASCTPKSAGGKVFIVTGAAGFVGYSVSAQLRERGDGVLGIDNFNAYYPVSLKRARTEKLRHAGVHIVSGDINDAVMLDNVFKACRPTHVLHFAAQAGVRYAAMSPLSYIEANVRGTTILLETIKKQNVMPYYIYASSSSVYGGNTKVPFSEMDPVDHPQSLYAATKREGELLATVYHGLTGLSVTGLRFFTVYGPWGRPDMAALAFAHKITKGLPIRIFTGPNGKEVSRDFTYIDDIVKGVLGAVDSAAQNQLRIFNLGNTHPHTVSAFVDSLETALNKKAIRISVQIPNLGDVMQTHSNITLANDAFGYRPNVTLDVGLQRFAGWFYAYYGENHSKMLPDEVTYYPM